MTMCEGERRSADCCLFLIVTKNQADPSFSVNPKSSLSGLSVHFLDRWWWLPWWKRDWRWGWFYRVWLGSGGGGTRGGAGRDEVGRYCWLDSSDDDLSGSKSHYTRGWKAETRAQRCSWVMEWRCGVLSLSSPRNWWKCIKRTTGDCVSRPCRAKQPSAVSIQVSLKYPTNLIAAQDHLVIVGLEQGQERNRLSVHLNQNI